MRTRFYKIVLIDYEGESNENLNFFLPANVVEIGSEQLCHFPKQAPLKSILILHRFTNARIARGEKKILWMHA
jgi:hypothetical protein